MFIRLPILRLLVYTESDDAPCRITTLGLDFITLRCGLDMQQNENLAKFLLCMEMRLVLH